MKKFTLTALLALIAKFLIAQTALIVQDTRSTPTTPGSYSRSVESHFKATTVLGLSSGVYQTVLGIRGWSDDTGGRTHELSFGDDNNISVRSGYSSTGWEGWRSLLISNENGNFGIGTSNPDQKLTIKGGGIGFDNNSADKKLYSPLDGDLEWMTHTLAAGHGFAVSFQGEKRVYLNVAGNSYFNGGNVGIGTINPTEKLAVNGNIRAREIKVEATNWPDYVFEDSYKVGKLEELESYIKTNKHLPDMPTAKEVETNGIAVSEMLKLQQKKIEELTLHLINLSKKVESQDTLIKKLKKKVK